MSFTAQCTPSSRASGAGSAPGLPKPLCLKRKGVDLVHVCDTANHSIVCVCSLAAAGSRTKPHSQLTPASWRSA